MYTCKYNILKCLIFPLKKIMYSWSSIWLELHLFFGKSNDNLFFNDPVLQLWRHISEGIEVIWASTDAVFWNEFSKNISFPIMLVVYLLEKTKTWIISWCDEIGGDDNNSKNNWFLAIFLRFIPDLNSVLVATPMII